ncbi:hypothetical protein Poli38472_002683 [Pythium oligandrum]|uniref:Metaxin n=1 Tax=Pythium oligandrum TaxID=41045 RepID=A0A8K1CHY5_PYTOL|nr:hypothetical protein Poli38472_002683 [Pythium oligandrum]|eukprot:TMW63742.1 hypothetical protein Poli38472_002683 [Pythium oligandrum]
MADDSMFPNDRFSSVLPETEKLHADLQRTVDSHSFTPKTSKEFGSKLVLHQFFPAWDVQAYVRMAELTLHVHNSKYPLYEATGELPQLSDGNFLVPKEEILQHLQTFHHDLDEYLSDVEKSESFAFRAMIHEKLFRVMLYCRWVDPVTYKEITRPQLKKHVPFPLNHFLPKKMHLEFIKTLQASGLHTKEQAYVIARDCYTALNAKLSSSSGEYFFGERVSALDAAVFGHVVDALSDPQLCKAVYQYAPLLVTHAERIRDKYFSLESEGRRPRSLSVEHLQASYSQNQDNYFAQADPSFMKQVSPSLQVTFLEPYRSLNWSRRELVQEIAKKKKEQGQHDGGDEDSVWPGLPRGQTFDKSTRNVIFGAAAAVVLYALANLPIQIRFSDDDDDEDELDDDEYYEDDD